ncbi:hypothetical protein M2480_001108 [Parabacteroides sp. PFB2-12]|uniref:RagB/SusD family nutrient uptake outer membrane protein n=1 Tax=unclassified Parabacteroides TaxID=2649774 RepID=UPI00247587BD|nr:MULTISPECIES: RagB/SusD family nutrient uptake outer membrane protein [unclassified Parabacteroides]MDH6342486.1 hypothetical protein [Parabacteroides sp. PM6-13]MDH6390138.1 hypothetical protein [Parabacteroides sp. PFB2-12]
MKLYKCKNWLTLLLIALVSGGCTELYDTSYGEIIAEQFEPTEKDIPALIGSAYTQLRASMLDFDGVWRYQEITADQVIIPARPNGWVDGGLYRRAHEHSWTASEGWTRGLWTRIYQGITNCNRLIYQMESGFLPIKDQELYNSMIAELRVTRASYYYLLCDLFGNVPISTKFDIPDGFLPEQSTRKQVYDFILAEITECLPLLSSKRDQSTYARFNEWAARTLMAKMYINAEVYTGTAEWEKCIQQCDLIINSGAYKLEANQKNVFVAENENSPEIILGLAVDPKYTTSWNAFDHHMQTLPAGLQYKYDITMEPWGGMCAIPQFIDTFDPDDKRYTENFIYGPQYAKNGTPILITVGSAEYKGKQMDFVNEVNSIAQSEQHQGIRFIKYDIAPNTSNCLENDFVLFRYADVLMMKAECLLRTGKADEAAAIVTEIRQRAFTNAPEKAVVTGAQLMEGSVYDYGVRDNRETPANTFEGGADIQYGRFLDELAWEFNQEGRRRQDLIRFGVFTKKSWFSHEPNGDYRTLFPIPQREMDANGNLKQNPGY